LISRITFDEDGSIIFDWVEEKEIDEEGGETHSTWINPDGLGLAEELVYYAKELRDDAEELLARWLDVRANQRRKSKRTT
jgi:hypothetical protein